MCSVNQRQGISGACWPHAEWPRTPPPKTLIIASGKVKGDVEPATGDRREAKVLKAIQTDLGVFGERSGKPLFAKRGFPEDPSKEPHG